MSGEPVKVLKDPILIANLRFNNVTIRSTTVASFPPRLDIVVPKYDFNPLKKSDQSKIPVRMKMVFELKEVLDPDEDGNVDAIYEFRGIDT